MDASASLGRFGRSGAIVEQKALTPEKDSLSQINSGIYAFKTEPLLAHLDKVTANNAHREHYLTDMAGLLRGAEGAVARSGLRGSRSAGDKHHRRSGGARCCASRAGCKTSNGRGLTIFRPETCVIDADVEVRPTRHRAVRAVAWLRHALEPIAAFGPTPWLKTAPSAITF